MKSGRAFLHCEPISDGKEKEYDGGCGGVEVHWETGEQESNKVVNIKWIK